MQSNLLGKIKSEKALFLISMLTFLFFYLWDLGNIDGVRQGTEGFYLRISSEMFEKGSFITPYYYDLPHWSKPPLHFWLPMPFYILMGGANLFAARFVMVLVSLGSLFYISNWVQKYFKIDLIYSFIFFASTLGFLKYSRVFMMEIPLSLLSINASLLFYDYFLTGKKKYFLLSSLFLALSILVKGPVSFVMCVGGAGLYILYISYKQKKLLLKKIIYWSILGLSLSSIWFIACYIKHGKEFIEYFFLRENLGKFTAQSYPIRVVFQGLLIYALPWSLFFPLALKRLKNDFSENQTELIYFLSFNFVFFFSLWLIPNQRSHHYAISSLPFFLILILVKVFNTNHDARQLRGEKIINYFISFFSIIFSLLIFSLLSFEIVTNSFWSLLSVLITAFSLFIMGIIFIKKASTYFSKFYSSLFALGSLWVLLIPVFYLPFTPEKVVSATKDKQVAAAVRKPFFVEEALQKKITLLDPSAVYGHIKGSEQVYIVHESLYRLKNLHEVAEIEEKWPIWLRGRKLRDISDAIQKRDLSLLQENMLLLKPRSLD